MKTLKILTESAIRLGQGDFSEPPKIKARDEIGILSGAFQKMTAEIQRLLSETRDKARMEAELKTASLVQESLLPNPPTHRRGEISLSGQLVTSTECGGDWWYYFEQGDDVYVAIADATGHGTPAALVTAAARAAFAIIEKSEMTLSEMMSIWDHVVASCSAKRVYMTAALLKINTKNGKGSIVNACHEWPFKLTARTEGAFEEEQLSLERGSTLGERRTDTWTVQEFNLGPGDLLLLYTDGLFSVADKQGRVLSDRRFGKRLSKLINTDSPTEAVLQATDRILEDYLGAPIPDDITLVAIKRQA